MKNNHAHIKAVLFDLDGTLLDTAPDLAFAINRLLIQLGKPPIVYSKVRYQAYGGSKVMLCENFNISDDHPDYEKLKQQFFAYYADRIADQTTYFPGMESVLTHLEHNAVTWGIVTNKPYHLTEKLLQAFNLLERCQCLVAGDSLPHKKPHPLPLQHACQTLNILPAEAIYIGDTEGDMIAAKSAGLKTIAVTYGYHPKNSNPALWQSDYLIHNPSEIIDYLSEHIHR